MPREIRFTGSRRLVMFIACAAAAVALLAWASPVSAQEPGITSPGTGSAVGGDVPVLGTAVIDPFQKYELYYKLEPSGDDAYIYFDGGTSPVSNGQLAVWRAAALPSGEYSLRLRVVKLDGNYAEYFARNLSVNQGPTPTPTSDQPTETPIPTATFTPAPQPTPEVGQVEQPGALAEEEAPAEEAPTQAPVEQAQVILPTATPAAVAVIVDPAAQDSAEAAAAGSVTRELGEALAIERLRGYFFQGMRLSGLLFLTVGLIFGGRRLFEWLRTR
ncbi:MAG: hypothetical protein H6642_02220 [Caldilineaceae bacterium]|nr:hypothetical protein [Caldilineaceae bacterium]